jgi:hypothetical protein
MENYQPVKFYTQLAGRHHNNEVAQGRIIPLLAPGGAMPSFQVISSSDAGATLYIRETDNDGRVGGVIGSGIGLTVKNAGSGKYALVYPGTTLASLPNGLYTLNVLQGTTERYSDPVQVTDDRGIMKLEFWHHEDFEVEDWKFDMSGGFKFRVYLRASSNVQDVLGKPAYIFEESVQRRAGYNFILSALSIKRYIFETLITEPLMDGLRMAKVMSNRQYTVKGVTKQIWDMSMNLTWEETGYVGILAIEIDTETVVMTVGKYRPQA